MKAIHIWTAIARVVALLPASVLAADQSSAAPTYTVVGTGQTQCYDDRQAIPAPRPGQPFYGQDAQCPSKAPAYRDNGNGTISDLNTGLMWIKARGEKKTWAEASAGAAACRVGGHSDWRMPTIKEIYSLINFNGGCTWSPATSIPYLNTNCFDFVYGDASKGERPIDCQDWSATRYVSTTMDGNPTIFGVNFADGRIKGYPETVRGPGGRRTHKLFVRYVRGNPSYGTNDFQDNHDGTVTDRATGLMWSRADSGQGMNWQAALAWVQARNTEHYLGHNDWRLPNAKELQSLVDYTRAPAVTQSATLATVFECTAIQNEGGQRDWPAFWTGTTHLDGPPDRKGRAAVCVCFGRALGYMSIPPQAPQRLLDVHGAGAQRTDFKSGDPAKLPKGLGPQGDVMRINNFVRLVRGGAGAQ
ncbi:MAG TPA: DUF1566 domain-containing protein [Bacillota bacterium]|nr:DUF1566 domain-containing protein [Bacillota bacterium]